MEIISKIKEIFRKLTKKEEIPKINLKIVNIETEPIDVEPNPIMLEGYKRQKTPFSLRIKRIFVYLDIIDIEDPIEYLFADWIKSLLIWIFNILMTGSLIFLAMLPFYTVPFVLIPFTIFSFGLAYWILIEILKEVRNIIKTGKHG